MRKRTGFNPKRCIRDRSDDGYLRKLAEAVRYGGNPEHKRNPGDFGLTPPSQPKADKTLCDVVGIFKRSKAAELLKAGVLRGLISKQQRAGFPQNIWAMTADGEPLEAQLENPDQGTYHGYPMPDNDPFRSCVIESWNSP